MNWRYEPLHTASGEHHMRHEEDLLAKMEQALSLGQGGEASLPLLRLYQWDVPTVSLGRAQTPQVALAPRWELWSQHPEQDPIGPGAVVHRPTGGRAVWHEQELTYAVLFPQQHPVFQQGTRSPEDVFGHWLLAGAQQAGVTQVRLERGSLGRDPLGFGPAPCFASTSRHELKWHGVKWVGSARRLGKTALLQHGAIRLGPAGDRLEQWLTGQPVLDERPWGELPSAPQLAQCLYQAMENLLGAAATLA